MKLFLALAITGMLALTGESRGQPIMYVDGRAPGGGDGKTWATAIPRLQGALHIAEGLDGEVQQVWVAAGVYDPRTFNPAGAGFEEINSFELKTGLSILGGFKGDETFADERDPSVNVTILTGDLNRDDGPWGSGENLADNSWTVVRALSVDETAILDGFTIVGGLNPSSAGGVHISGGNPIIRNCKIIENLANSGGGLLIANGSNARLVDCAISYNFASVAGGGVAIRESNPIFERCIFRGNFTSSSLLGAGGGVSCEDGNPTFLNCLISGCSSFAGGAIYALRSNPQLMNCTLSGNYVINGEGGGIFIEDSSPIFQNGIIVGNLVYSKEDNVGAELVVRFNDEESQIWSEVRSVPDATLTIAYSSVQGLTGELGGVGNIGEAPLFVDPIGPDGLEGTEDDDHRLSSNSPCIDAGDPNAMSSGGLDLEGKTRIMGTRIDMGAYESGEGSQVRVGGESGPPGGICGNQVALVTLPLAGFGLLLLGFTQTKRGRSKSGKH